MKNKESGHRSLKKKWIWIFSVLLLILATAAVVWIFFEREKRNEMPEERMQLPTGMTVSENVITAVGLTQVGMSAQEWELDFLEDGLVVEETYLHVGDAVEADTPIFKVTQESLEKARQELELAEKEASLNLREGEITYETGKIDAQKNYDLAVLAAEYAQASYDQTVLEAQKSLEEMQTQVEKAQEKVDTYTASIESDYYYTYYEVAEKEQLWHDYASLVIALYEKWNIEELEEIYGGMVEIEIGGMSGESGMPSDTGMPSGEQMPSGSGALSGMELSSVNTTPAIVKLSNNRNDSFNSNDQSKYEVYTTLEEETASRKEEYEAAQEEYEKAKAAAVAGIEQAKSELKILEAKLVQQQDSFAKTKLSAQAAYDTAIADRDTAQLVYDAAVKQLEEEYEALKDRKEEASENLALFTEKVGDGYYCTKEAGTVMMNPVRKEDILKEVTMILAYQDTSDISVSASVDQSDIASVSIGQEAMIVINGYEPMEAVVTSIDPVSSAQRGATVTYSVTVCPQDTEQIPEANMTAYVYFGLSEEEKGALRNSMGGRK